MQVDNLKFFKNFDINKINSLMEYFKNTFYESYAQNEETYHADLLFSKDMQAEMTDKIIEHYINYAERHHLAVDNICPFKVLSTYGFLLAELAYTYNKSLAIKALSTAIICMQIILEQEELALDNEVIIETLRATLLDISISKEGVKSFNISNLFGLGMNGLYMLFKGVHKGKRLKKG